MKKITLFLCLAVAMMFTANTTQAQEEGKFRVGMNPFGIALPSGGLGFTFDIEPKYNLADNMNVGLRIGVALLVREIDGMDADGEGGSADLSANTSFLGTFDYYFPLGGSFTPFVGAGAGIFNVASASSEGLDAAEGDGVEGGAKFGGLLRGGFEVGKFRMGIEYNIIPKTTIEFETIEDQEIKNGYLGVTFGFFIGGGRWG